MENKGINNIYVPEEFLTKPVGELNIVEGNPGDIEKLNLGTVTNSSSGTFTIGTGTTTNTINTLSPWSYYYYQYPTYQYKTPWVSIEKAENGFIVVKNGQTFVCKNVKEVTVILEKKDKNG